MQLISEPLPRNANGKVIKRQLREAFVAGDLVSLPLLRGRWVRVSRTTVSLWTCTPTDRKSADLSRSGAR